MPASRQLRVALVSLGCPKNLIDSEKILALLAEGGCIVAAPMDQADVIVVNTCGFLEAARQESLQVIGEALAHKRAGRAQRVVVAGCLVNRDAEQLYKLAPGIDAIVGVNNRHQILQAVTAKRRVTRADPYSDGVCSDAGRFRLTPRHTAYLRICEGCDRECSFCTIPAIRGPFRSKQLEAILAEARELIADGAVELNVIGQDTTAYGRDLGVKGALASLLRRLDRLDGVRWIRLMYAYPRPFDDSLIEAIASTAHIVAYIDLPLQHISDPILRRMKRGITRAGIEKLLVKIRRRIGGAAIRTTFIVGFPGESDAQFAELLEFVREFQFDALGVFEFCPEPGTTAAELPRQIPDDVKADRARALMAQQQQIAFAANSASVGRPIEVLVDGVDTQGRCVGRYYAQAPDIDGVCYLSEPRPPGTFVTGKIVGWEDYDLLVRPE